MKAAFPSLPQGQKVCEGGGLEENLPEKIKKTVTADKSTDDLSPVLCLTVTVNPVISPYFSTHIRRNSLRPATSAHLIPTVRNYYFSVIWNLSVCLCFHNASEQTCLQWFASAVFKHKAALRKQSGAAQAAGKNIIFACLSMLLYHRNAAFAMSSIRTKPQQYTTETQLNLYKPETFPPHLSAFGVWESFRAVSKARRDFFYTDKPVFQKSLRVPMRADLWHTVPALPFFVRRKERQAENCTGIVSVVFPSFSGISGYSQETLPFPCLVFPAVMRYNEIVFNTSVLV